MHEYKKWIVLLILGTVVGCQPTTRKFPEWKFSFPKWGQSQAPSNAAPKPANGPAAPGRPESPVAQANYFNVLILESTGTQECLENAWSYLDESAPMSRDWQVLNRNGLRCGVGQFNEWPTIKEQLDKCNTHVRSQVQVTLGQFNPVGVLTDKARPERTLFYYDRDGKIHGEDVGPSRLEFSLMTAGRMPEGRIRVVFSPRIITPESDFDRLAPAQPRPRTPVERELENFSVIVDVGPQEFTLIGPSKKEMPHSLVGPQLFCQWERGERKTFYILISPLELNKENPPAKNPGPK